MDLGPPELIIILVIVLLLFGGRKLPELARSLGQAKKEFESETKDDKPKSAAATDPRPVATPVLVEPIPVPPAVEDKDPSTVRQDDLP